MFSAQLRCSAFGSVIMTFVGVNYYLTGMHSYGQGNPPAIPAAVYVALIVLFLIIYGAYLADKNIGIRNQNRLTVFNSLIINNMQPDSAFSDPAV